MSNQVAKLNFFCFWECGFVGVNMLDSEGYLIGSMDLRLDEAKDLLEELTGAINAYERREKWYIEEEEEEKEAKR